MSFVVSCHRKQNFFWLKSYNPRTGWNDFGSLWSPYNKCIQLQSSVPQLGWRFCLPRASSVPSLCLQWCKLNDDCDDHCASIWRVWQPLSNHGDGSAFFLPLLYYLLCLPSCLEIDGSFKGGIKVAGAVTQKQDPMGLDDHGASWSYFLSLKGGTKVITLCEEDLSCQEQINSLHESWRSVPSYSSQSSHTSTSSHWRRHAYLMIGNNSMSTHCSKRNQKFPSQLSPSGHKMYLVQDGRTHHSLKPPQSPGGIWLILRCSAPLPIVLIMWDPAKCYDPRLLQHPRSWRKIRCCGT